MEARRGLLRARLGRRPRTGAPTVPRRRAQVYFQIGALLVGGLVLAFNLDNWAGNEWRRRSKGPLASPNPGAPRRLAHQPA